MAATSEVRRLQKKFLADEIKTIKGVETRHRSRRSAITALAKDLEEDIKRVEALRKRLEKQMKVLEAKD